MNLPTLYKRTSTGAIQEWHIDVLSVDNLGVEFDIITTYGLSDGKKQQAVDRIKEGKNIGKANETSVMQQAELEAQSQWEKKKKKGYVEALEDAEKGSVDTSVILGGVAPMLAHVYEKQGHKIKYPCFVQPKLDGHRCIAVVQNGKATLWSRTQKRITGVPHIQRHLEALYPNESLVLDGELYNHDYKDRFEELSSFIRSATPKPGHEVVQYWVYDFVTDEPFSEREKKLEKLEEAQDPKVVALAGDYAADEEEMIAIFGVYLNHGFEGLMTRNLAGRYSVGRRSYDLQKVKVMQDAEFEVTDIIAGRGKMANAAIFVCKTDKGDVFQCVMATSHDERERYLREKNHYIGKFLTIKYQNMSNYGIPRFPVGLRFREDV